MAGLVPAIHVFGTAQRKRKTWMAGINPAMTTNDFAVEQALTMSTAISPLAPTDVPDMPAIAGVRLATAAAGIRYKGRTDVLLALLDKGTTVAGVFTKSKCPSAPVEWCRARLKGGQARGRWWSIPATPTPSPARPAAQATKLTADDRRQGGRLQAQATSFSPRPA